MTITDWMPAIVAGLTACGGVVAAYFTSRAAGRAAVDKAQAGLAERVKVLEESEPVDIVAAREAAQAAHAEAKRAHERLDHHVREEQERRQETRTAADLWALTIAAKLDTLGAQVTEQATDIKLLANRISSGEGSRRGR